MDSILTMIRRFRHGRPTCRRQRQVQQQKGELKEMWWLNRKERQDSIDGKDLEDTRELRELTSISKISSTISDDSYGQNIEAYEVEENAAQSRGAADVFVEEKISQDVASFLALESSETINAGNFQLLIRRPAFRSSTSPQKPSHRSTFNSLGGSLLTTHDQPRGESRVLKDGSTPRPVGETRQQSDSRLVTIMSTGKREVCGAVLTSSTPVEEGSPISSLRDGFDIPRDHAMSTPSFNAADVASSMEKVLGQLREMMTRDDIPYSHRNLSLDGKKSSRGETYFHAVKQDSESPESPSSSMVTGGIHREDSKCLTHLLDGLGTDMRHDSDIMFGNGSFSNSPAQRGFKDACSKDSLSHSLRARADYLWSEARDSPLVILQGSRCPYRDGTLAQTGQDICMELDVAMLCMEKRLKEGVIMHEGYEQNAEDETTRTPDQDKIVSSKGQLWGKRASLDETYTPGEEPKRRSHCMASNDLDYALGPYDVSGLPINGPRKSRFGLGAPVDADKSQAYRGGDRDGSGGSVHHALPCVPYPPISTQNSGLKESPRPTSRSSINENNDVVRFHLDHDLSDLSFKHMELLPPQGIGSWFPPTDNTLTHDNRLRPLPSAPAYHLLEHEFSPSPAVDAGRGARAVKNPNLLHQVPSRTSCKIDLGGNSQRTILTEIDPAPKSGDKDFITGTRATSPAVANARRRLRVMQGTRRQIATSHAVLDGAGLPIRNVSDLLDEGRSKLGDAQGTLGKLRRLREDLESFDPPHSKSSGL